MRHARIGGRGIEARLVGAATAHGRGHFIVDFEDRRFGAILAMGGDVLALDDGEGLHDVLHIVAGDAVEVEVGGVEFAAQQEAPLLVPAEGRAVIAAIVGKGLQVPGGVGEFEDAGEEVEVGDFAICRPTTSNLI